jgi:hypothetical protein
MSKLLRSDFYRLFKSKSFYICSVIAFGLFILNLCIAYWASKLATGSEEIYANMLPKDGISFALSAFANGNVQMILAIITGIYITADFAHGTMKNVVSKGFSRIQIYLSKLITMIAAVFIIIAATFIVGAIGATIISGKFGDLSADSVKNIVSVVGIEILLNTALTSLLVFVGMLFRNLGGTIAFNILGVLSFGPLIFSLLEILVKNKIKFTEFSLSNNIMLYIADKSVTGSDYLRSAIVALVFFAISTGLGIFAFQKTDVK